MHRSLAGLTIALFIGSPCPAFANDSDVQLLLRAAGDPAGFPGPRGAAIGKLKQKYPEKALEHKAELAQWEESIKKAEESVEKANKTLQEKNSKQWAIDDANARRSGVTLGMTKAQVLKSLWGKPRTINTTYSASGKFEQWVYSGGYLYFRNDVLSAIQN